MISKAFNKYIEVNLGLKCEKLTSLEGKREVVPHKDVRSSRAAEMDNANGI